MWPSFVLTYNMNLKDYMWHLFLDKLEEQETHESTKILKYVWSKGTLGTGHQTMKESGIWEWGNK